MLIQWPREQIAYDCSCCHSGSKRYQTFGGSRKAGAPHHPSSSRKPVRHSGWPQLQYEVSTVPQCQVHSCITVGQICLIIVVPIIISVKHQIPQIIYPIICVSLSRRGNAILDEIALKCLRLVSKTLRALVLSGNPLVETVDYRLSVLIVLPQLERLDKEPVSPRERIEAQERIHVKIRNILILFAADALLVFLMSCVSFQELKEEEISEPWRQVMMSKNEEVFHFLKITGMVCGCLWLNCIGK